MMKILNPTKYFKELLQRRRNSTKYKVLNKAGEEKRNVFSDFMQNKSITYLFHPYTKATGEILGSRNS